MNISIIDHGKKGSPVIRRFDDEKQAEEFIEKHERPYDLDCEFNPSYAKARLEKGKSI